MSTKAGELQPRWRRVDLAAGWLTVTGTKTDAGARRVKVRPALLDELAAVKARTAFGGADDPVFATRTGKSQRTDNLRERVVSTAVERANQDRAGLDSAAQSVGPRSPVAAPEGLAAECCSSAAFVPCASGLAG